MNATLTVLRLQVLRDVEGDEFVRTVARHPQWKTAAAGEHVGTATAAALTWAYREGLIVGNERPARPDSHGVSLRLTPLGREAVGRAPGCSLELVRSGVERQRSLRRGRVEATLALMRAGRAAPGVHNSPERRAYDADVVAPLRDAVAAAFDAEEAAS